MRVLVAIGVVALPLIILPSFAIGQPPAVSQAVKGRVVDELGNAVAGAEVSITFNPATDKPAITGADGKFEIAHQFSPNGQVIVVRTSDGSKQAVYPLPYDETEAEKPLPNVYIKLNAAETIAVRVTDDKGAPVDAAQAGATIRYHGFCEVQFWGQTDSKGDASWKIPSGANGFVFVALKSNLGLDYVQLGGRPSLEDKPSSLPSEPISITLQGAKAITPTVVDEEGKPIVGAKVMPWFVRFPNRNGVNDSGANLSWFGKHVTVQTDAKGQALFDWLPASMVAVNFSATCEGYEHANLGLDPNDQAASTTLTMQKWKPQRGRVFSPDGSPAKGAVVQLSMLDAAGQTRIKKTRTDDRGAFEIPLPADRLCMIGASQETFAAKPVEGIFVKRGADLAEVQLRLQPGIRLHGKLTTGDQETLVGKKYVTIRQIGKKPSELSESVKTDLSKWTPHQFPWLNHSVETNAAGEFAVYVSPGKFTLEPHEFGRCEKQTVELATEREKEIHLHHAAPSKLPLTGQVISAVDQKPLVGAAVLLASETIFHANYTEAIADADGKFQLDRLPYAAKVFAISTDGTLAGLATISESDSELKVVVHPRASLRGRAIDGATGRPLANQDLHYGVPVVQKTDAGLVDYCFPRFGQVVRTNEKGEFEIGPIATNVEYFIQFTTFESGELPLVASMKAEKTGQSTVGDVVLRPLPRELRETDGMLREFKGSQPPLERLEKTLKDAKLARQRVAVLFATPEDPFARSFYMFCVYDREGQVASAPFDLLCVSVEAGETEAANLIAQRLGLKEMITSTSSRLVMVENDGVHLATVTTDPFLREGKLDKVKLGDWLNDYRVEPLKAEELWTNALAEANRDGKRILIEECATWCGPCRELNRFLDRHRATWEKDLVWLKMDHRWSGAQDLVAKLRGKKNDFLPWWAILDEEGKVLITSDDEAGFNVAHPREDIFGARFKMMMQKAALRMTEKEIDAMTADLAKSK